MKSVVRLARFELATFGSGDRRSNPTELQAHAHNATRLKRQFPTDLQIANCKLAVEIIKTLCFAWGG
jgi:hypothetical protein